MILGIYNSHLKSVNLDYTTRLLQRGGIAILGKKITKLS